MLPNAELAIVDQEKIVSYLLNQMHPDNGGKAQFFFSSGFSVEQWELLQSALRSLAINGIIIKTTRTLHGDKFAIDGSIDTPSGKSVRIRSIWIIDQGSLNPRLVTAYPQA